MNCLVDLMAEGYTTGTMQESSWNVDEIDGLQLLNETDDEMDEEEETDRDDEEEMDLC